MRQIIMLITIVMIGFSLQAKDKPNIIYILSDDLGYGDIKAFNNKGKIPTPYLDKMAEEGMIFTDAHTNSSVCTPTRYGIITGRYAWRTYKKEGVLSGVSPHLIPSDRETVASYLKGKGYSTACFGKWHLGMDFQPKKDGDKLGFHGVNMDVNKPAKNGPLSVGFDRFFGIAGSLNMSPHGFVDQDKLVGDYVFAKTSKMVDSLLLIGAQTGYVDRNFNQNSVLKTITDKTIDWIEEQNSKDSEKPFFVYLPLNAPHSPIVPAPNFIGKSGLLPHGDFTAEVDYRVGEIIDAIKRLGIDDNTMIVFTSDNGVSPKSLVSKMETLGHYSSGNYRGLKGSIYEAGHRVPFIVRWPKEVQAGKTSDRVMCTTDFFATVSDYLGDKLADNTAEDSFSFLNELKGINEEDNVRGGVVHHSDNGFFAIREGDWKLIFTYDAGSKRTDPKDPVIKGDKDIVQLFNMKNDPYETTNVSKQNNKVVKHLSELMADYIDRGRSTKGKKQKNDDFTGEWKQLEIIKDYVKSSLQASK